MSNRLLFVDTSCRTLPSAISVALVGCEQLPALLFLKLLAIEAPDGYGDKDDGKDDRRDQRQPREHGLTGHERKCQRIQLIGVRAEDQLQWRDIDQAGYLDCRQPESKEKDHRYGDRCTR